MSDIVLAVDLGGTNIRMAAVAADGTITGMDREKTPRGVTGEQLVELTARLADRCTSGQKGEKGNVVAIAFASPAPAPKYAAGVLTKLPNIPSLNGFHLGDALRRRFGVRVVLENDANAATIGEHWLGASKGTTDAIHITLGTGVGGGLIISGEPFRGIDGTGGEIGHINVEPDGHPCGCGSRGCIEQYASASAIARMSREAGLDLPNSYRVYEAATAGDKRAQGVFEKMGRYLGITLAGIVNTLNPEMITIGGGAAAGWDAFMPTLLSELKYRAFDAPVQRVKIVRSTLGDNAGILGAARSAFLEIVSAAGE